MFVSNQHLQKQLFDCFEKSLRSRDLVIPMTRRRNLLSYALFNMSYDKFNKVRKASPVPVVWRINKSENYFDLCERFSEVSKDFKLSIKDTVIDQILIELLGNFILRLEPSLGVLKRLSEYEPVFFHGLGTQTENEYLPLRFRKRMHIFTYRPSSDFENLMPVFSKRTHNVLLTSLVKSSLRILFKLNFGGEELIDMSITKSKVLDGLQEIHESEVFPELIPIWIDSLLVNICEELGMELPKNLSELVEVIKEAKCYSHIIENSVEKCNEDIRKQFSFSASSYLLDEMFGFTARAIECIERVGTSRDFMYQEIGNPIEVKPNYYLIKIFSKMLIGLEDLLKSQRLFLLNEYQVGNIK